MKYLKFTTAFFLIAILCLGSVSAKTKPHVKVFYVSGRAEYLPSDEAEWERVKKDTSLYSGDSVKTYENSYVEIAFDAKRKNMVNIESNTYVILKLEEYEKIELIDGEVFSLISKLPHGSRFEIRTPTAICGARGTGWGARGNKNETVVSAYEKDSYAKGIDRDGNVMEDNLIVKEGFKTIVKLFEKPSKLMKISDADYERWNRRRDALVERLSARRTVRERLGKNLQKMSEQKEKIEERRDEDRINRRVEKHTEVTPRWQYEEQ